MKTIWLGVLMLVLSNGLSGAPEALLVPPTDKAQAGQQLKVTLFLNNPTTEPLEFNLPAKMGAEVASIHEQRTVLVLPVGIPGGRRILLQPMSFTHVTLAVMLPDTLDGNVSLKVRDPESNAIMFAVNPAQMVRASPPAARAAETAVTNKPEDLDLASEQEKVSGHISSYDPIYAALGFHGKETVKFQFSFKYRLFGPAGNIPAWWRELYFGYTQTSLWNLSDASKPFYDTSYKPAFFYLKETVGTKPDWLTRLGLQAGVQHESNGGAGDMSRSLNTVFVTPLMTKTITRKWNITVAPRMLAYLEKSENPGIASYRGYVDLMVRIGAIQGVELTSYFRKGSNPRYGSMELDLTWPLRKIPGVASTVGGNLLLQYFNGWGESLRDFDVRRPDQLRLGFVLVR